MTLKVVSLFVCLVMVSVAWQNDYDRDIWFACPTGKSVTRIKSKHHNWFEDRLWEYSCGNRGELGKCQWFYNVNQYDGVLLFKCPNFGRIVATKSYHNNYYEDRRFSFQCCTPKKVKATECRFTNFVNVYDGYMDYTVPNNKFLRGAYSVHKNFIEDRIWKFEICDLDTKHNNNCKDKNKEVTHG
ncbi:hypothetical protein SNE40_016084 [Patella caerulea]|uniref:Dermatopontin n=1 Tax=Patella caerulea TaxID=87958 RepID=A0AAN8JB67_PATCE